MNGPDRLALAALFVLSVALPARAQLNYQPTRAPLVTAENERWYLAGEPVMHSGTIYYPSGPQIHFMPYEMVRSGFYHGIPLYIRTTIEPHSIVFVPVGRGLMQPYERRRAGELAGTTGSQAPSFPVTRAGEEPPDPDRMVQAPAPPYRAPVFLSPEPPVLTLRQPIGSLGTRAWPVTAEVTRKDSANGLFVEFQGARWFSSGQPVQLEPAVMTRIGERFGFPVYERRGDNAIYIPISSDPGAPLARYARR